MLIADDHSVVRMGLRFIIGHHFGKVEIFESEDCTQTVQQLQKGIFTHLVLDLQLKDGNGLDIFTDIRETYPGLHILIHSSSSEEVYGRMLMQRGAKGYLHKQAPDSELVKAFQLFFMGRRYISPAMEDILAETKNREPG